MEQILRIEDIIKILHIDADTAIGLLESGEIQGFKINRQWRIKESDLVSFLDRKIESQTFETVAKSLSSPKKWAEYLTKYPDLIDMVKNTDFPKGSIGAIMKEGLNLLDK